MQKDDFWSIDKLIPRIHSSAVFSKENFQRGILLQDLEGNLQSRPFGDPQFPKKSRCILSYRLSNEILPASDAILDRRAFNEKFQSFVPCNEYSPSLSTLNKAQKQYFFFFLEKIDRREKIQISYPHLQLFLCRMIRYPQWDNDDLKTIVWVWEQYRRDFPLADKLFCDTISDYCFYRNITPPYNTLSAVITKSEMTARPFLYGPFIFDYLFDTDHKLTNEEINFVLRCVTLQSFRKSKAYRCNKIFAAASESAVKKAFDQGLFNRKELNDSLFRIQIPSKVNTKRRLFSGLPLGEIPDVEIDLNHVPFLHDDNIRSRCDELIRYLENRLRKILKIKNSLSRIHISDEHRIFLEGIILEYEALAPKEDEIENPKADQREFIEPRELKIDFELATKIEEDSWSITQALTESYTRQGEESILLGEEKSDEDIDKAYSAELQKIEEAIPVGENEFWEFAATLSEIEDEFLRSALHQGKDAARILAQSHGMFFDAMIMECNKKAGVYIGDAILDPTGQVYSDYANSLKEVFPPLKGE